jgi:hypothetical protein
MPKPVLQAMVLADHVYQDRTTGKFIIAGTFGTIWRQPALPPRPPEGASDGSGPARIPVPGPLTQMGSPYLYLALTDVHGKTPLTLRLTDLSNADTLLEANFEVAAVDPIALSEYVLPMPLLPVAKTGSLSLDLLYEGEILGTWRINVRDVPSAPPPITESGGSSPY